MVLAAGQGTRLRPLTHSMPKALVPVAGRPMIEYPLRLLRHYGIREIMINLHHFGEQIEKKLGSGEELNQSLENAGRVADFLEFGELMCLDALQRKESCGGHFREEFQTPDGEARRDDEHYSYVAAWQYAGPNASPVLNKEPLTFEYVHPTQRSYK